MGLIIEELKFSRMNDTPIEIFVHEEDYPIAPLVFAENLGTEYYKLQIVVYIPSEVTNAPEFMVLNDGYPVQVMISGGEEVNARNFIFQYDYAYKSTPISYTAWEIYMRYSLKDMESVDYVLTHLRDMDPKTSRGTVTTVQHA